MQVFWAYIVGMITSLGKMKLDRIHSMLKMFAMHGTGAKEFTQVLLLSIKVLITALSGSYKSIITVKHHYN